MGEEGEELADEYSETTTGPGAASTPNMVTNEARFGRRRQVWLRRVTLGPPYRKEASVD
jgi:hypothetical protein